MILDSFLKRFKQNSMESKVREAVESGIGVYNYHWELGGDPQTALEPEEIDSLLLDWCRETMGDMRRPYGLDYVTMAVALLDEENRELARYNFGVLRPSDLYADGFVPGRLAEVTRRWQAEDKLESSRWLSIVMFSWGDITRDVLLAS